MEDLGSGAVGVVGDTNATEDIFVHDRTSGETSPRLGRLGWRTGKHGQSFAPAISPDGRYVAFASSASNLVSGDTNGASDVFVRDRGTGTTTRVSVGAGGAQASGASDSPSVSADGRYVAFRSPASNLVSGDTNAAADVFVRDRGAAATTRMSVDSAGEVSGEKSGDTYRRPKLSPSAFRLEADGVSTLRRGSLTDDQPYLVPFTVRLPRTGATVGPLALIAGCTATSTPTRQWIECNPEFTQARCVAPWRGG